MNKSIGKELRKLHNIIKRNVENNANYIYASKVTSSNVMIINYLNGNKDKDIYQKDIENTFSITRSTTSKVLSLMEQKKLIVRINNKNDARLKKIILTDDGMKLSNEIKRNLILLDEKILNGFSENEKNNLFNFIERMRNNIND